MKKRCPYCGRVIRDEHRACAAHRDLPALDFQQTMWMPSADVYAEKIRHWIGAKR